MIELYRKLVDELRKEKDCYGRLLFLTIEQKQSLISGDLEKVAENLKKQEKEVFALSPLLGERTALLTALGKAHRLSKTTLDHVLKKAPMEIVEELKTAVIELVHSARELETINQGNEKLVDNALSLADMTLKALVGRERSSSKSHTAQNVDAGSSFVNRVV